MFKYHSLVLILCLLGSTLTTALAQDTNAITTVIFVRHAEKADDGTRNPPLNIYGQERAARLAQLLHLTELAGIYSTPFNRTQQTVKPLAAALNLEVKEYPPLKLDALDQLVIDQKGKTILIVGHSNTVPAMVNHLLGEEKLEQLSENEYDKIFMLQITDNQTQLLQLSF